VLQFGLRCDSFAITHNRKSSISKRTDYELDSRCSFLSRNDISSLRYDLTSSLISNGSWKSSYPGVKWPECETDLSLVSIPAVYNRGGLH
jgi:hypothetical protein